MNEDRLRQLLATEASKVIISPRAQERTEQRAAQLRKRRSSMLTGAGGLALAAAVLVAVLLSVNSPSRSTRVLPASPAATESVPSVAPATPLPAEKGSTQAGVKSGPGRCHTSQIGVSRGPVSAAAGTISASFVLTNTSKASCAMYGYPGFSLLDSHRQPMIGDVIRGGGGGFPAIKLQRVVLSPGRSGSFSVGYSDLQSGGQPCSTSSTVVITPPDETTQLYIADQVPVCSQRFYVSPVVSGVNGAVP
jgi:hypothetical protein